MVAQSDDIRPGGKDLLRVGRQQAVTSGVFPVGHHKVDGLLLFQGAQMPPQMVHAPLTCYIADGQHLKVHGASSVSY